MPPNQKTFLAYKHSKIIIFAEKLRTSLVFLRKKFCFQKFLKDLVGKGILQTEVQASLSSLEPPFWGVVLHPHPEGLAW